jgi:hypothetical protein
LKLGHNQYTYTYHLKTHEKRQGFEKKKGHMEADGGKPADE